MRKVHHPKIVQRCDGCWMVVCDDCARDRQSSTPVGINIPVESREMAQLLWENHCERRRPPNRRSIGSAGVAGTQRPDETAGGPDSRQNA